MVTCLPNTGATELAALTAVSALLLVTGVVLVVRARRGRRAAVAALGVALLCAGAGAVLALVPAEPAQAATCRQAAPPGTGNQSGLEVLPPVAPGESPGASPSASPSGGPTPSPSPTTTSTPPPTCPSGADPVPAGYTVVWTPIPVADPRDQPGSPGDVVRVYTDNIRGYTWHLERDGAVSPTCAGQPSNGSCIPSPRVSSFAWRWNEASRTWELAGDGNTTDGCTSGSGGSSGGGGDGGG